MSNRAPRKIASRGAEVRDGDQLRGSPSARLAAPVPATGIARFAWLLLLLAAVAPFLPALWCGFTFDDQGLIIENPAVWASSPAAVWTAPYWPQGSGTGLYRPWTAFSFWWNGKLGGPRPALFHAVNLLLHAATVLLLFHLLRRLFPSRFRLGFAAALLFAVHPLHSEAIVSVVGRAELWAAALGLLAWYGALHFTRRASAGLLVGSTAVFALALLSKESAAGLLLLPLWHLAVDRRVGSEEDPAGAGAADRRRWIVVLAAWSIAFLLILCLRARILGDAVGLTSPSLSDNALAHETVGRRVFSALGIQWILMGRTLWPWSLAADASYRQIVPGPAWMAAGAVFLAAAAVVGVLAWRRRDRDLLWGIGIVLAGGFVTTNIPMAVGTIYAERLAYLPSAGSLWILVLAGARLGSRIRWPRILPVLAVAWGLFLGGRSWIRTLDWRDNLTLFRSTVAVSPRSAKAWTNLAVAYLDRSRVPDAVAASGRALELLPGYPAAREARGTALTRSGRAAEAVEILRPAAREIPPRPRSLIELGNAWISLGRGMAAESAFVAASRLVPPTDPHPAIGLASAYALQERWREAVTAWRRAVVLRPGDPAVLRSYAWSLWQAGVRDSSEAVFRTLLARDVRDAASRQQYAWLLGHGGGDPTTAVALAREAFRLQPDPDTADTLLESMLIQGDRQAARVWLDSLTANPPAAFPAGAIQSLQERWEKDPGSSTIDDR